MSARLRSAACLIAAALVPVRASADAVYLKNGQSFEGVEAVVLGGQVRIDLAIGSMRIAMSQVERIEEVDSTLGDYRDRELQLGREPEDAADWIALALWARTHDFAPGVAKAALMAARLDPELDAVEPLMASLHYLYDDVARQWVPYDDAMRRRGLVEDRGGWITPEEKRERADAGVESNGEEPRSRADDHLDKALDILAAAVAKPEPQSSTTVIVEPATLGFGYGFFPGFVPGAVVAPPLIDRPGHHPAPHFPTSGILFAGDELWGPLTQRQPGSFIPATRRFFH
jgi:hypothetical protein